MTRRYVVTVHPTYHHERVTRRFFTRYFAERFADIFRVVPESYRVETDYP